MANRSVEHTIEAYLAVTSLNIHSIAYDIHADKVIGGKGIDSILRRIVEVNDCGSRGNTPQRRMARQLRK